MTVSRPTTYTGRTKLAQILLHRNDFMSSFSISLPDRSFLLRAETKQEVDAWVRALQLQTQGLLKRSLGRQTDLISCLDDAMDLLNSIDIFEEKEGKEEIMLNVVDVTEKKAVLVSDDNSIVNTHTPVKVKNNNIKLAAKSVLKSDDAVRMFGEDD